MIFFTLGHRTVLGDDLYRRQPMCKTCLIHRINFIVVCLPTSHSTLYGHSRPY